MNPWRWVDPRVRDVRLGDVRRYLESREWQEKPSSPSGQVCFQSSSGGNGTERFTCVLPASELASDYALSLTYFLTTLSEIENRHPVVILEELLRMRLAEPVRPAAVGR